LQQIVFCLFKIAFAACHTSGLRRVHLSAKPKTARAQFSNINISQASVGCIATLWRCGRILTDCYIANFAQSKPVKEF